MANRNLVTYTEPRNQFGPYWRLKIDRSANGQPTIIVTIETDPYDGETYPHREMTIVVKDAYEILDPVLEWLNG